MSLFSQASPKSQVVADGLSIDMPEHLDITYQTVPIYDDTENVIAGWDGDELKYFITFSKLPPGWLDAGVWIAGFTRDIIAASERDTFTVLDRGTNKSRSGFDLEYIKISYKPEGGKKNIDQLVHFITNHKNSYVAVASPLSDSGENGFAYEVKEILQTAYNPASNVMLLTKKNETRYLGVWTGGYECRLKGYVSVIFELKPDLTFTRKEIVEGEQDGVYSGIWSISNKVISWTYLHVKGTSQDSRPVVFDRIESFTGNTMALISDALKCKLLMQKPN